MYKERREDSECPGGGGASPVLRARSGRIRWAVTWELLFSTTARRRKARSSQCTASVKLSLHMGLSGLRWMGLVRKWQQSHGAPSTSSSMHGLPAVFPGHTF